MTQSREALAVMDGAATTVSFGKRPGAIVVSRCAAALLLLVALAAVAATGLLVFKFASCPAPAPAPAPAAADSKGRAHIIPGPPPPPPPYMPPPAPPPAPPTPPPPAPKLDVRLPRALRPRAYTLRLTPFIFEGNFTFHGEVELTADVVEPTDNVTLHAHDLAVDSSSVRVVAGDEALPVTRVSNDTARQFLVLSLGATAAAGRRLTVSMRYVGRLNDVLQGFYRSSYTIANETRWIAVTQFQPTDARRAFPCFDEPALKARFTISLARPRNMTSISNMPRAGDPQPVDGLPDYEWDHYGESVPMSTYLVAWAVTDFAARRDGSFAVWARASALQQAAYSLHVGPRILRFYEQYFNISYPLPKVDMIALPDFAAGAMENWGLITYRETAMLYEQGVSTNSNKQSVATVVAHELAHQWFGNLVTPSWWTDLWLNEGFASYVEYLGVNAVEPTWKILEQFVSYDLQNVFALDALESSHPISIAVGHPDEINEIFDRISYGKGASIIRMMDHFLTTDVFKKGLHNYLKKWSYDSSTQNDLWQALTEQAHADGVLAADVTVKRIMDTWTLQTGFPVVTVTRDYDAGGATVTQERFLLRSPENGSAASSEGPVWWVPLTYTSADSPDFESTRPALWMRAERSVVLPALNASADHWLIFNIQETGFYRVNYDARNWALLAAALADRARFERVGVINRAQLLDDALALARAGRLDYATALGVTRYLAHELEFLPWKAAFNALGYLDSMLIKTGHYDKFKAYMLGLVQRLYEHTGFTDNPTDPQLTVYKRVNVLSWSCSLGLDDCVRHSVTLFQNWRSTPDPDANNPISPNLKNVVYCTALRVGGQEEWDFAWQRYLAANVGSERDLLLGALGCSRETWILSRYLEWAVTNKSGIRKQDAARVFGAVSSNVIGQRLAYAFLRSQWDRIREYLGASLFTINNIVRSCTRRINTQYELDDLAQFATVHRAELGTATRAVEQALEQAEANVRWMRRSYQPIVQWLTAETAPATPAPPS
ncbi:hypothetical protein R5R35_013591 [Gryllus longicercus]|uniref:Aminopeptidase N n=1 Tax=Gryllus longicercus TaxID=2509291 RepID=A0AAN9VLR8_9ORTH